MQADKADAKVMGAVCKSIDEVSLAGTDSVVPGTIERKMAEHRQKVMEYFLDEFKAESEGKSDIK